MAARFWIGGGTNTNWNASPTTNWSATSGGAVRVAAPTVSDDVTFDGVGASGNTASIISATQSVLSLTFASGYTQSVTVNAALTIAGNFTDNTAHTWAGTSALTISAASTITSGGKTWPNSVTFSGANTKTLSGNWTITGTLTVSGVTTLSPTVAETLTIGGLTMSAAMSGTVAITLNNGTWQGASVLQNNLTIAGAVTIINSGSVAYNTGTLTWSSGAVTTTGSTLTIGASTTVNTNGITWNNITLSATQTLTINSLLSATGIMTISSGISPTFAGTAGFTVATFTCSNTTNNTLTFKNGVTYTITTAINAFRSSFAQQLLFTSDDATLTAILTLNNGATCNCLAEFRRINASNGRAIWTFNGTITTCNNIFSFNDIGVTQFVNKIQAAGSY